MANNIIRRKWNQNVMVSIEDLTGNTFQDEAAGHTFEISGVDNYGNAVAISGTVSAIFMRADNTDVAITGAASDGIASVTLPAECYDVPGRFGLTVFVTANSQTTAIYAAIGTVRRTSSGNVSPGTTADVVDLINRIDTAVATIPASWSGLMADIAPTYSSSAVYPVGTYVYYDGDLYRCTTAITTAESWTAAHWTASVLGNDVSDLKSAFDSSLNQTTRSGWESGIFTPTGGERYPAENWIRNETGFGYNTGVYKVKVNAGYVMRIYAWSGNTYVGVYKTNGTFEATSTNVNNTTSFDCDKFKNYTLKIAMRREPASSDIVPSEGSNAVFLNFTDDTLTVVGKAADAKATGDEIEKLKTDLAGVSYNRALLHGDFDYARPYNIFNGTTWTPNKKVAYLDGSLTDNPGSYVTDYMEIDNTKEYLCVNIYVILSYETGLSTGGNRIWYHEAWAFYDENKTYIETSSTASATSKIIPPNAKYVRLTAVSEAILPFAMLFYGQYSGQQWVRYVGYQKEITEVPVYAATGMENLNMVMFGDSITHGNPATAQGISYTDYANDILRSNIINCGLGGTRMSQGQPTGIGLGSFASLCENIASDDPTAWDALETYATASHSDWASHIANLKNADWNSIQAIGIFYGANDWHNNVSVGQAYNEDPTLFDGACAYGLKKILTKYPHLQVLIFTPMFREADGTNSDVPNGAGLNMDAYGASLKHVQTVFHCPVCDLGNEININRYTLYTYTASYDGTHPRRLKGLQRMGWYVAEAVRRYIQPY